MTDKKSQLTYLVSINDAPSNSNGSFRNSIGLEPVPYFCTKFNLETAVVYLSRELQEMGLNCNFIDTGSQKLNVVSLVNACWEITQLYRSLVQDSNTLLDQRRRDASNISHFQSNVRNLRTSVEEKERQVCDAQERERQSASLNKSLSSKIKSEKEEVRRLNSALQQREGHHQHELRKKETENNRLKERLYRLVSGERSSESCPGSISMSSTLSRSNRSRAMWKTEASGVRHEEEIHRKVLGQYEAWVGQLNNENDQLKTCLSSVSSQLSKIVNKFTKSDHNLNVEAEMNSSMYSTDSLENPLFNLEFPTVKEQIEQLIDENLKKIIQLIEEKNGHDTKTENVTVRKELEVLQVELARMKDKSILKRSSEDKENCSEKVSTVRFLDDALCVDQIASLEKMRHQLEMERKSLQQERETFSNAAVRLNREKALFEADKAELLKRQFLQELPPTLNASVDMTASGHESTCSLSSGSIGELFTDSPQRKIVIPAITPPRVSMNLTRMSTPIMLGPTRLPKQQKPQRDSSVDSLRKQPAYRLKSAPVSRASSVTRQEEETERKSKCEREIVFRHKSATRANSASKRLTIPHSSFEDRYFQRELYDDSTDRDYTGTLDDSTNLKTLENDLLSLIAKIGQQHGEAADMSADEPPPYETVAEAVTPRRFIKTKASALVSAPGSLSSSRRSSQDLSNYNDLAYKRTHKPLVRK